MSYPKIAYVVSARHGTFIIQRSLLRETAKYYLFADRFTAGREDKVFKDRITVCYTFDEAKATLLKAKQRQIEKAQGELDIAKEELDRAHALTGPTHIDEPVAPPAGPLVL